MSDGIVSIPWKRVGTLQFVAKEKYDAVVQERDALEADLKNLEARGEANRQLWELCARERDALKTELELIRDGWSWASNGIDLDGSTYRLSRRDMMERARQTLARLEEK